MKCYYNIIKIKTEFTSDYSRLFLHFRNISYWESCLNYCLYTYLHRVSCILHRNVYIFIFFGNLTSPALERKPNSLQAFRARYN